MRWRSLLITAVLLTAAAARGSATVVAVRESFADGNGEDLKESNTTPNPCGLQAGERYAAGAAAGHTPAPPTPPTPSLPQEVRIEKVRFSGGDLRTLRRNLTAIAGSIRADARVVPGHGPLLTREDVEAYGRVVDAVLAYVAGRKREGRDAGELEAQGLPASIAALTRWPLADSVWIQAAYEARGANRQPTLHRGHQR